MYAAIVLAVVLFAGCSGGSSNAATPTPATQRPSASGSAPEVATCAPGAVSGVSDAPVGSTAMMSLVLWFGQAGTEPCTLPVPRNVTLRDGDGMVVAGPARAQVVLDSAVLQPGSDRWVDLAEPPNGSARLWLVWSWKDGATGPCRTWAVDDLTIVVDFGQGIVVSLPAKVTLGPCDGAMSLVEFAPIGE